MIRFYPSTLNGNIEAPPSKSYALRLLFISAMASTPTKLTNIPDCKDVWTAIECLDSLGCKVKTSGKDRLTALVEPFPKGASLQTINYNFRDSATTARFLTVITSAYGMPANCQAEGSLLRRSQVSMTSRMALRGVTFSNFSYPLNISGRLFGGEYTLRGDEGSQFISALLVALPVLQNDSHITIDGELVDDSFIQMTIEIIKKFGIKIIKEENGFTIPGQQYYTSPKNLSCENDWGLSSLWIAAAAAENKPNSVITVSGLYEKSLQHYRHVHETLGLLSQDFHDVNINAADHPNLVTFFEAIAALKGSVIRISGVPQLKYKELNRLSGFGKILAEFGASYESTDDGIIISGIKGYKHDEDAPVDCLGDPWVFMSLALACCEASGPITLTDEKCHEKIYKNFLKDYQSLGGKYEIID